MVVREALPSLGDDVVLVSLDIDLNESAELLARYAREQGFAWRFAVAPSATLSAMQQLFGTRFLHPPNEPMFLVDARGVPFAAPGGPKDARTLRQLVDVSRL